MLPIVHLYPRCFERFFHTGGQVWVLKTRSLPQLHPSFSSSFLLLLSNNSASTSSAVGNLQPTPSPISPGISSQFSSSSSPSASDINFLNASISLCFSYASKLPSSSSKL